MREIRQHTHALDAGSETPEQAHSPEVAEGIRREAKHL